MILIIGFNKKIQQIKQQQGVQQKKTRFVINFLLFNKNVLF